MTTLNTDSRRLDMTSCDGYEHAWTVESRHLTSEGEVRYVRCDGCGTRRIDAHRPTGDLSPVAISVELRPR